MANRTRKHKIQFYLNDLEYRKLKRNVSKTGLTISSYFRKLLENKIPKEQPSIDFFQTIQELHQIELRLCSLSPPQTRTLIEDGTFDLINSINNTITEMIHNAYK